MNDNINMDTTTAVSMNAHNKLTTTNVASKVFPQAINYVLND